MWMTIVVAIPILDLVLILIANLEISVSLISKINRVIVMIHVAIKLFNLIVQYFHNVNGYRNICSVSHQGDVRI